VTEHPAIGGIDGEDRAGHAAHVSGVGFAVGQVEQAARTEGRLRRGAEQRVHAEGNDGRLHAAPLDEDPPFGARGGTFGVGIDDEQVAVGSPEHVRRRPQRRTTLGSRLLQGAGRGVELVQEAGVGATAGGDQQVPAGAPLQSARIHQSALARDQRDPLLGTVEAEDGAQLSAKAPRVGRVIGQDQISGSEGRLDRERRVPSHPKQAAVDHHLAARKLPIAGALVDAAVDHHADRVTIGDSPAPGRMVLGQVDVDLPRGGEGSGQLHGVVRLEGGQSACRRHPPGVDQIDRETKRVAGNRVGPHADNRDAGRTQVRVVEDDEPVRAAESESRGERLDLTIDGIHLEDRATIPRAEPGGVGLQVRHHEIVQDVPGQVGRLHQGGIRADDVVAVLPARVAADRQDRAAGPVAAGRR